jgi:ABC-2 type transport system permease protein
LSSAAWELREYQRNRSLIFAMAIFPLIFSIQPLMAVFGVSTSDSSRLAHGHMLLYMLGIPVLLPIFVAAYAVVGERQQGTFGPMLTTPIRREDFLLGKALAALIPPVVVACAIFANVLACVGLFAQPGVASTLIRGPDLLAQVLLTPLLASGRSGSASGSPPA